VGTERLKVRGVEASSGTESGEQEVQAFVKGSAIHVLVIGYEMFKKHSRRLKELKDSCFVCDEGHRLKNSKGNQTIQALASITCRRRLLLTGTPVQNDLLELYAMCEWVNPSYLGDAKAFRQVFEQPIARSRESGVSGWEKELGSERSKMLSERTAGFVLRRDARLLRQYLPPKTECVLFCPLQPMQRDVYSELLKTKLVRRMQQRRQEVDGRQDPLALTCLNTLVQVSNHPVLLFNRATVETAAELLESDELSEVYAKYPTDYDSTGGDESESGKMRVLIALLAAVKADKGKAVVVSNYVRTLNVIETLCSDRKWPVLRLDGQTPSSSRQSLVDEFNSSHHPAHIFLLSAKAGGQGLNLIGGNRLVLFDPDWNPATDLQAMARIWRDGQQLPVVVYRLLSAGCVDEKIYQRQLKKQAVASMVEAGGARGKGARLSFDSKALRELFTYKGADCACDTYDVLMGMSAGNSKEAGHGSKQQGGKDVKGGGVSGSASGAKGGREKEITVGGKRWECCWDVRDSGEEMVRGLDDGMVSCVWWRTSTADDIDDEEVELMTQAEREAEDDSEQHGKQEAHEEEGEEEKEGSNEAKVDLAADEVEEQQSAAGVASDGEVDVNNKLDEETPDEQRERQSTPRSRKRLKQQQPQQPQEQSEPRPPKKRAAALLAESDEDEDEAFPSYQPTTPPVKATAADTRTEEEKEAADMVELQQLLGSEAGGSKSAKSKALVGGDGVSAAVVGGRWDDGVDALELDMDD